MKRITLAAASAALLLPIAVSSAQLSKNRPKMLVEFEMMTWPEVKDAIEHGKTVAIVPTGGTEQRGPQNANGGHNLMSKYIARNIALRLGNAIVMPVLPYTPNNASATLPGTIGLTPELLTAVLTRVVEQTIATGFKTVVITNDHGGGVPNAYKAVVDSLEPKYASKGIHIYYADEVYAKAQGDFDKWLEANGYPVSSHAGIPDTSTMMYLDSTNVWVRRDLVPEALGDIAPAGGRRGAAPDPNAPPRKNNGISGEARRSSAELGKKAMDMKIDYAVKQIQGFMAAQK